MRRMICLALLASIPAGGDAAAEKGKRWVVLPARAETPPPRDPTLLRLSSEVGASIQELAGAEVVVVSREMRDDACPSFDGDCPRDVVRLLDADRVFVLRLEDGYAKLALAIYGQRGLEQKGALPCRWSEGLVSCETTALAKLLAAAPGDNAVPAKAETTIKAEPKGDPKAKASGKAKATPPSAEKIAAAFKRLAPRFKQCKKLSSGDAPTAPGAMKVHFRIADTGKVTEVRLEPRGYDDVPAFACMARAVESLRFPTGVSSVDAIEQPLP